MTPTDTDRFLARVKQRAEDGWGFAAEDMLRVLSVVEGLSLELLEAKARLHAQATAAANLASLVGLVREVMADTGAEALGVVSDDGQMLSRWSARPFLADLESILASVGAPLGAAPALSAEGSIPSLPCSPTEERWVAFVSDDRGWVCDSLSEARHTIEDELGTRTQEEDEWGGDEEEMWVGRVQITERVTEIYRGPDPSGRHDEIVNYALRPVSTPFRTETK